MELKSGRITEIPEKFVDWSNKFQDIYRFTKDNKLHQFCFRFLHRITVTRRELKLFHLADNDKCIYCSSADSIEHTFIDCRESVKLYLQIISWFNQCQGTTITLSNEQIVFRDIQGVSKVRGHFKKSILHPDFLYFTPFSCRY